MIPGILYPPESIASLELAWQLCCHGNPRAALEKIIELLDRFKAIRDLDSVAVAQLQRAWFCFQLGNTEQGIVATTESLVIWRESKSQAGVAMATAMQAWLLLEDGLADQAVEASATALATAEECLEPQAIGFAANVAGVVQWYCRQPDRALELCERALDIARSSSSPETVAWWLINIAGIHALMGTMAGQRGDERHRRAELALADALNGQAIDLSDRRGDVWCLHLALCNAAEYLAADDPDRAWNALERCAQLPDESLGPRSQLQLPLQKAGLLACSDRHQEVEPICLRIIEAAVHNAEARTLAHLYLSQAYETGRDFERALRHLKAHHETAALVVAENTQRRARIADIIYQTASLRNVIRAAEERAALLSDAVLRDPLTNCYNRRALDSLVPALINNKATYAIAMFDLDHFKTINDRFSHATGDDVLRIMADLFTDMEDGPDLVIRMGGEEFCLVFVRLDAPGVMKACERLRYRVSSTKWSKLAPDLSVTTSIGVATASASMDLTQAIRLADERLYIAKRNGRNRVIGDPGYDPAPILSHVA